MRQLVRDDRFGFASGLDGARVEQNDRAHQPPADRRRELVAGEQRGAVLEAHPPLRASHCAQPVAVDQHLGAGAQRNQPHQRQQGDHQQDRGRDRIGGHRHLGRGQRRHRRSSGRRCRRRCRRRRFGCDARGKGIRLWRRAEQRLFGLFEERRRLDVPAGQDQRSEGEQDQGEQPDVRDPRPLGRRAALHQLKQPERRSGDDQRLQRDRDQDGHYLPPLAWRARLIIACSSSSSSVSSLSDMPSSADAALAGEPLKKTRTISLSADFLAAVSDTNGL